MFALPRGGGGGGTPIKVCAVPKGMGFQPFWSEMRYRCWPFLIWSRIGYGFCTIALNWVRFLEQPTFPSFTDMTIN